MMKPDSDELTFLIKHGEGYNIEFKESFLRNNLLFGLMQRMELVEKVGSGILRMKNAMSEYGLESPRFDVNENWFTIIFDRPQDKQMESPQKTPQKMLTELEAKILEEIKREPSSSMMRIAEVLKISQYTVKEYMEKLKQKNVIERIGADRGGYWRVKDDGE